MSKPITEAELLAMEQSAALEDAGPGTYEADVIRLVAEVRRLAKRELDAWEYAEGCKDKLNDSYHQGKAWKKAAEVRRLSSDLRILGDLYVIGRDVAHGIETTIIFENSDGVLTEVASSTVITEESAVNCGECKQAKCVCDHEMDNR